MNILAWPAFKNSGFNPYNKLLYDSIAKSDKSVCICEYNPKRILEYLPKKYLEKRYAIFHCHWPFTWIVHKGNSFEKWLKVIFFLITIDVLRFRGTKIVWTVHNIEPHEVENHCLKKFFWRQYIRRIDGWISLSETSVKLATDKHQYLDKIPHFVIPHGHYRGVYPNNISQQQARLKLGINPYKKVAIFIGMIRTYKNVPFLIEMFKNLAYEDWELVVAGKVLDQELEEKIFTQSRGAPNIRLFLKFIEIEEVQTYLNAANITILPFRKTLNSGSAVLSLSFDKPVLVPDQGSMKNLKDLIGKDWIRTYTGELTEEILKETLDWAIDTPRDDVSLEPLDWSVIGCQTLAAYRSLLQ